MDEADDSDASRGLKTLQFNKYLHWKARMLLEGYY
jgi:hypothetical protein